MQDVTNLVSLLSFYYMYAVPVFLTVRDTSLFYTRLVQLVF